MRSSVTTAKRPNDRQTFRSLSLNGESRASETDDGKIAFASLAVPLRINDIRAERIFFGDLFQDLTLAERQPGFSFQGLRDRTFFFVLADKLRRIRSSEGLTGNSSTELNRPSSHSLT
jgi:hypothetical protein